MKDRVMCCEATSGNLLRDNCGASGLDRKTVLMLNRVLDVEVCRVLITAGTISGEDIH